MSLVTGDMETSKRLPTMMGTAAIKLVDLRLTRPPIGMKLKQMDINHRSVLPSIQTDRFEDLISSPKKIREGERHSFTPPKLLEEPAKDTNVIDFRGMLEDKVEENVKRYHSMLLHFIQEENGSLMPDIDLKAYEADSHRIVSNITVQELCKIHRSLDKIRLHDCNITDVALWCIGKYAPQITGIFLSRCLQITNIGLRSFSLRCSNLRIIDLSGCSQLDDTGLMSVASGCWQLEHVSLAHCTGISDDGLCHLTSCSLMRHLDLTGCRNIGDFGSKIMKDIGRHFAALEYLSFLDCKRVEDAGLMAVARGCPRLKVLLGSGGDSVSAKGFGALMKHLLCLNTLVLRDCSSLRDKDVVMALRARSELFENRMKSELEGLNPASKRYAEAKGAYRDSLLELDLSGAVCLSDRGVAEIARSCVRTSLLSLNISCTRISDEASNGIAMNLTRLRSLDLSACNVGDSSIHTITSGVTALSTLKINCNDRITTDALISHVGPKLPFAELAMTWVGYQPRYGYLDRIRDAENEQLRNRKAVVIQAALRRKHAYKIYRERIRARTIQRYLPMAQALVRGFQQMKRYNAILLEKRRVALITRIQCNFRSFVMRRRLDARLKAKRFLALKEKVARLIQRAFRGMQGRTATKKRRDALANLRVEEAKVQAKKELSATLIQRHFRGRLARNEAYMLIEKKEKTRIEISRRNTTSITIQRVLRGLRGRAAARKIRAQILQWKLEFYYSLQVQRIYRSHLAKKKVDHLRQKKLFELAWAAALKLQRKYRGSVGYRVGKRRRAEKSLHILQNKCSIRIQRVARGYLARNRVNAFIAERRRMKLEEKGALMFQRLFRGHKGREAFEIEKELIKFEAQAKPLFIIIEKYTEECDRLQSKINDLSSAIANLKSEIDDSELELDTVQKTTSRYSDSSRLNKTPQRFITKYLRVRLKDYIIETSEQLARKNKVLSKLQLKANETQRLLRETKRELIPLTTGLITKVKKSRCIRLRAAVRRRDACIIRLQSAWRGFSVKKQYADPARDYWIICLDDEQTEHIYYYNTWTGETSWKAPYLFKYVKSAEQAPALEVYDEDVEL